MMLSRLASAVLALLSAISVADTAPSNKAGHLQIAGEPLTLEATSVKCELGRLADLSTHRLANCRSAELVELAHEGLMFEAVRFTIAPDDRKISDGIRAELRDMHEATDGEVAWYRIETLLPKSFPVDKDHRLVLTQWHERVRDGGPSLRPPLSHRLWNGRFVVTLWNGERIARKGLEGDGRILFETAEFERGTFHDFVYRIRWSDGTDGEIAAWHRKCPVLEARCAATWQRIIRYRGATGYDPEIVAGYYFKFGLYTVSEFEVPFTAYHRSFEVGRNAAEVGATGAVFR